jgi:hypothetical protein
MRASSATAGRQHAARRHVRLHRLSTRRRRRASAPPPPSFVVSVAERRRVARKVDLQMVCSAVRRAVWSRHKHRRANAGAAARPACTHPYPRVCGSTRSECACAPQPAWCTRLLHCAGLCGPQLVHPCVSCALALGARRLSLIPASAECQGRGMHVANGTAAVVASRAACMCFVVPPGALCGPVGV